MIDSALAETARAGELLRRVRDFISRGDLRADYIDLNLVIRQGVGRALVANPMLDLDVKFALDPNIPKVFADPIQMGQVLLNLARNSITAMEDADVQTLTIETTVVGENIQVSVHDTGPGIPEDVQGFIFEPFHTSTTKGMGIGLSLCRSVVEAHAGRIWAQPSETGATLAFQIPIQVGTDD